MSILFTKMGQLREEIEKDQNVREKIKKERNLVKKKKEEGEKRQPGCEANA